MTLYEILARNRLSQRHVAKGAGVSLSAVSDIVTGKRNPRTDTVNRILTYLRQFEPGLTFEQIFGDTEERKAA